MRWSFALYLILILILGGLVYMAAVGLAYE